MWIAFFLGIGVLNLYVAYGFSEEAWVNFKLFGILGITFAFVIGQAFYLARFVPDKDADDDAEQKQVGAAASTQVSEPKRDP